MSAASSIAGLHKRKREGSNSGTFKGPRRRVHAFDGKQSADLRAFSRSAVSEQFFRTNSSGNIPMRRI